MWRCVIFLFLFYNTIDVMQVAKFFVSASGMTYYLLTKEKNIPINICMEFD